MKIIVSHPGKQYVHHMLFALQQKGYLKSFFTTVWLVDNKTIKFIQKVFPFTRSTFRKRSFDPLDSSLIRINLFPELLRLILTRLFPSGADRWVLFVDRMHDRHVSRKINSGKDAEIVLAYENCSLLTFKKAKERNKITILDLAQIHHHAIADIRKQYSAFNDVNNDQRLFDRMDKLKTEQNKYVDYFFTLSEFAKNSLLNAGIPQKKIYKINLGFDPTTFQLKKEYRHQTFKLLFVGTITRRKGIHLIIDAFKKLNIPNSLLEIVGPVSDGGDLLENLPDNIKHVPYLNHDELVSYYQRADVFVFPSYLDSWAMVVLEAMACGTPVIISENTGSRDAVEKGGGFVIPVDDANALMEKILYFYQNPEIIESTGRKAHQIAQHYTWQHYYQNVQRAVEEIYNREIEKQR